MYVHEAIRIMTMLTSFRITSLLSESKSINLDTPEYVQYSVCV